MTITLLLILLSLALLAAGAEFLVRGSASLAVRAGVSPLVAGLTIVAFGTSSPELVVSVKAALAGRGDIAVGNVVGSNLFNIGVILGLTALLSPIPVHRQILRIDAPLGIAAALLLPLLLREGTLSRPEAGLLILALIAYIVNCVLSGRTHSETAVTPSYEPSAAKSGHWLRDAALAAGGLAMLIWASRLLVDQSVILARTLGVSEAVIGLTIVAAGTSMPEMATSVVAAFRRQPDIAIGNVVGSNIFNILGILGVAGLCAPLHAPGIALTDYAFMAGFTVILLPFLLTGRRLGRLEGACLLGLYLFYLHLLWP